MKLNWGYIAASLATGALICWGGNVALDIMADRAGEPVQQSTVETVSPAPAESLTFLPPCPTEDSDDCIWDAAKRGTGGGRSFIAWHGDVYYLDGSWRDYVTINDETIPAVIDSSDGINDDIILYCHAPFEVGIDVDSAGNQWAACM